MNTYFAIFPKDTDKETKKKKLIFTLKKMDGIINKFFGKTPEKTVTSTSKPKSEGVQVEQMAKTEDQGPVKPKGELSMKDTTYLMDMDGEGLCFHALYMVNSS